MVSPYDWFIKTNSGIKYEFVPDKTKVIKIKFDKSIINNKLNNSTYTLNNNGNKPSGNKPNGNNPSGNKPSGNKPSGNKPNGNKPSGNKPSGNNPSGNKPSGNNPSGNKPRTKHSSKKL